MNLSKALWDQQKQFPSGNRRTPEQHPQPPWTKSHPGLSLCGWNEVKCRSRMLNVPCRNALLSVVAAFVWHYSYLAAGIVGVCISVCAWVCVCVGAIVPIYGAMYITVACSYGGATGAAPATAAAAGMWHIFDMFCWAFWQQKQLKQQQQQRHYLPAPRCPLQSAGNVKITLRNFFVAICATGGSSQQLPMPYPRDRS